MNNKLDNICTVIIEMQNKKKLWLALTTLRPFVISLTASVIFLIGPAPLLDILEIKSKIDFLG